MTETSDLIANLSADVPPIRRGFARRRILTALAMGTLVAIILMSVMLGLRPDLDLAMAGAMFWMKTGYTASLALIALAGAIVLARPEAPMPRWLWLALVPVALLGLVSAFEMAEAPPSHRMAMWLGDTWSVCPFLVLALAMPILAAMMFAYRSFAPTQLRAAGAVLGLGAGAAAATVYCLHCPESTASFVLTWYSLGIALAALVGALAGPRLLRW